DLDGVAVALPTATDALLNLILSTNITPDVKSNKQCDINYSNFQCDEALDTFLDVFRPDGATEEEMEKVVTDAGVEHGGSSVESDQMLVDIFYGAISAETGKIQTWVVFGGMDSTSGGGGAAEYNKWSKPKIGVLGSSNTYDCVVPLACFDTAIVTAPAADITIPADKCYKVVWMTPAA
nr:hypothetical protein [Candidatus Kapabacteria bacterium]